MTTGLLYQPWHPVFGVGAPGAAVSRVMPYFDTSTNPFTAYVYHSGAWHSYGDSGAIDATHIQGVAVDATPPNDGDSLFYVAGSTSYVPGPP